MMEMESSQQPSPYSSQQHEPVQATSIAELLRTPPVPMNTAEGRFQKISILFTPTERLLSGSGWVDGTGYTRYIIDNKRRLNKFCDSYVYSHCFSPTYMQFIFLFFVLQPTIRRIWESRLTPIRAFPVDDTPINFTHSVFTNNKIWADFEF